MIKKRRLEDYTFYGEGASEKKACANGSIAPQFSHRQASSNIDHVRALTRRIGYHEDPSTLFKLSEILDKTLESVVFTHQGILASHQAGNAQMSY